MKIQFKCSTCGELLGTLNKETITDEDREMYRESVTCGDNHNTTELIEITETSGE